MTMTITREILDEGWAQLRADRRLRAWLAVHYPLGEQLLAARDSLAELPPHAYTRLYEHGLTPAQRDYEAWYALFERLCRVMIVANESPRARKLPARKAWVWVGHDAREFDRITTEMGDLYPPGDSDRDIDYYLCLHGFDDDEITRLLAAWPPKEA
jgi:hypothetical protein